MFGKARSEVQLLRASREGSTQAFEVLVGRYQSLVCAITYGATGDVQSSEELAQEAFLQAWKCLGQLKDLDKFRAWLCSIARSTVQNWFRSRKHDVVGRAAPLETAAEKASDESGPEEAVMSKEQQAVVRQALAQMPEGLREPLILFYREGHSTREVAELLGLSENAARQRISRGRSMLREQMADLIETTIARTKPGKAFTAAVVASIAGLGVKGTATAVAATGAVSGMSALTAKIAAAVVGVVALAGALVVYRQANRPVEPSTQAAAIQFVEEEPSSLTAPVPSNARGEEAASAADLSEASPAAEPQRSPRPSPEEGAGVAAVREAPKKFEFQPRGVLSGLVTDVETGEPVSDAIVRITRSEIREARTDENGFYHIDEIREPGGFSVGIDSKRYIGLSWTASNLVLPLSMDKQTVKHFQLSRACRADVQVVDANGVGIPQARVVGVSLADTRRQGVHTFGDVQTTDPDGRILLGGFPPAQTDYQITAWHYVETGAEIRAGGPWPVREYDYAPAHAVVRLTDPEVVTPVRIVLPKGRPVQGHVQYADGVPAADVSITAKPVWWHTSYAVLSCPVSQDGTFTLKHIVPGLHDILVNTPTGDYSSTSRTLMQMQLPRSDAGPLVLRLAERSPRSLASISGSLVFRGQKPAGVSIHAESTTGTSTHTNVRYKPSGELEDTFVIDRLEPGLYRLVFRGSNIEEKVIGNVTAPSGDLQVELVYTAKPKLTGVVLDAGTDEPIEDFRLRVRKVRTLRNNYYVQEDQWTILDESQGRFSVEVAGPGVYQVQVAADEYAPTWSQEINTDEPRAVEVRLSAGGGIEGRVVNEKGDPVQGAKVIPLSIASGAMPTNRSTFMSEQGAVEAVDGAFALSNLPPGVETLKATHPDYVDGLARNLRVVEGETTARVEIVLAQGGVVEGHVYDDKGKPVVGEVISFHDRDGYPSTEEEKAGRLATTLTDSNGFYRVTRLPQQLCYVKRANEWRGLGVTHRIIVPRTGDTLRLDFGGAPVVSGAAVIDGRPLARSRLLLASVSAPYSATFKCYALTDDRGAFAFPGAARGTYGIYCELSEEPTQWRRIGTAAVAEANVDVGIIPNDASKLFVSLTGEAWALDGVCLAEGQAAWSPAIREATRPSRTGDPWIIDPVGPGRYTLILMRSDDVLWRTPVMLEAGRTRWDLSLELPQWDAAIGGRVRGDPTRELVFWRQEKDVLGRITREGDGTFRVGPLPPGRYFVGDASSYLYDVALLEFSVAAGETKVLDLDLSGMPGDRTAYLVVQAVDDTGRMCSDAHMRLVGAAGSVPPWNRMDDACAFMATAGEHWLHIEAAGYRSVRRKVTLETGDGTNQPVIVRLERR
jgi:RNA polymerase sigma factor (sigma-70 family)